MLSASANKLSKLKEQAEEYASLIMEELDPENLGYIEVNHRCSPQIVCFPDCLIVLSRPSQKMILNLAHIQPQII